jgi:GAF domain-containing protein
MEATADQVALALENVRLMHESRQWAQREFTIREIGDKVSASFDLDTILRTTVEELSAVLGASGALVELGLPQEET